jgi:hypothetical protein
MVFPSEFVGGGDGDSFSPCDECAQMTSVLWCLCQGAVPQKVYISVLCRALGFQTARTSCEITNTVTSIWLGTYAGQWYAAEHDSIQGYLKFSVVFGFLCTGCSLL